MKPVKDALGSRRYCSSIYDWTSGFFPGNLWYAYQLTGIKKLEKRCGEIYELPISVERL